MLGGAHTGDAIRGSPGPAARAVSSSSRLHRHHTATAKAPNTHHCTAYSRLRRPVEAGGLGRAAGVTASRPPRSDGGLVEDDEGAVEVLVEPLHEVGDPQRRQHVVVGVLVGGVVLLGRLDACHHRRLTRRGRDGARPAGPGLVGPPQHHGHHARVVAARRVLADREGDDDPPADVAVLRPAGDADRLLGQPRAGEGDRAARRRRVGRRRRARAPRRAGPAEGPRATRPGPRGAPARPRAARARAASRPGR